MNEYKLHWLFDNRYDCKRLVNISVDTSKEMPNKFKKWQKKYNITIPPHEYDFRFDIYKSNSKIVSDHNKGDSSFTYTDSIFATHTKDEFYNLSTYMPSSTLVSTPSPTLTSSSNSCVDWRPTLSGVTVMNQGTCGGCWAFATSTVIDAMYLKQNNNPINVSPQWLIDCDTGASGCQGGNYKSALSFVQNNGAVCQLTNYPYKEVNGPCTQCPKPLPFSNFQFSFSNQNITQDTLINALANGPVGVAIFAKTTGFQLYNGGVLTYTTTGAIDHAVVVVGYQMHTEPNYWIIQNSWGTSWGMNGIFHLEMSETNNARSQILSEVAYVTSI